MFRKLMKTMGSLTLALTLLFSLNLTAFAYTKIDLDRVGSITVTPEEGRSIGNELTLYKVADVVVEDADQKYQLTDDFAESGVDLTDIKNSERLAGKLSDYAKSHQLAGMKRSVKSGDRVTFENLSLGLYLIEQDTVGDNEDVMNPFLVSIPLEAEDGSWIYDVTASPKAEDYELVDITVNKVWSGEEKNVTRPSSVTVYLYRDDVMVEQATLSDGNHWSHTWKDMEKSNRYSVKEGDVKGYTATYAREGYNFTVTNTAKVAQTGQLNWPVPVLAGCGILLFAVGWVLVKRKQWDEKS